MKMWPSQYLNFSLTDPKKRTQLNCPKSWPLETEIINGYCFKRLSFGKFPTQQLIKFSLNPAKIISEKHNIPYVGQEASFRYKMTPNVSFSDYIIYSSTDVASFNPLCFQKPLFFLVWHNAYWSQFTFCNESSLHFFYLLFSDLHALLSSVLEFLTIFWISSFANECLIKSGSVYPIC